MVGEGLFYLTLERELIELIDRVREIILSSLFYPGGSISSD